MGDADMTKKRLAIEKADLEKQLNDGENALRNLSKLRTSLSTQVVIIKRFLTQKRNLVLDKRLLRTWQLKIKR